MNEELEKLRREINRIAVWVEPFAADPNESTYLCVLRLLADYRLLQTQEVEEEIERVQNEKSCN
jgi:archaellum component FlaC